MVIRVGAVFCCALLALPAASGAQVSAGRGGPAAFAVESAGGIAGSLAGFGVGYAVAERCDGEDLVCNLEHAAAAVATGTVFSALGAYGAGRLGDTRPSGLGASLGALVGAAAGIGAWHLATEELDVVRSDVGAVLTYGVTQGIITALGSRLVRALRD